MAKVKVKMSRAGAQAVLKSAGVLSDLESRAESIANAACAKTEPDGMRNDPFYGKAVISSKTAIGFALSATQHGYRASNKHDVLLKSIDAGR